jgi:hypothetical protein
VLRPTRLDGQWAIVLISTSSGPIGGPLPFRGYPRSDPVKD